MISAWARICKIMGPRFAPYLPLVMGPIIKTASLKPEVALLDNEELGGVENDSDDWQFVSLGDQQNFGIKTAGTLKWYFSNNHIWTGNIKLIDPRSRPIIIFTRDVLSDCYVLSLLFKILRDKTIFK